jgi:hypothetical protein
MKDAWITRGKDRHAMKVRMPMPGFLDHIEVSERRYHASDPVAGVRDAIMAARELI